MTLLWHAEEPIGVCVFTSPPLCLHHRNRYFGLSAQCSRLRIRALNTQLVTLSRVVLHPTYRGAGVAAQFVRRACETCPWPWIETLTEMGRFNPFFEKAGFQRLGVSPTIGHTRKGHSSLYGSRRHGRKKVLVSKETFQKSRHAQPIYYLFDNRQNS